MLYKKNRGWGRRLLVFALVCGLLLPANVLGASTLWDGYVGEEKEGDNIVVDMNNMGVILNAGSCPVSDFTKTARYAAYWGNQTMNTSVLFKGVPRDWSNFLTMEFWMYSKKKTNSEFMIVLNCDQAEASGSSYYYTKTAVDWEGWKQFSIDIQSLSVSRSARLSQVNNIQFVCSGWSMTPDPETQLYIDSISVTGSSGGGMILPTDKFPSQVKEDFKKQMENSVGIYDYRNQVYAGGQLVALDENDTSVQIVESGDVSMAPLSFFEKFLGAAVTQEGDQAAVELNGVKVAAVLGNTQYTAGGVEKAFSAAPIKEGTLTYLPVVEVAKALGKQAFVSDDLTIIGQDVSAWIGYDDLAKLASYTIAYIPVDVESLTSEDFTAVKDNWRARLTGGKVNDTSDEKVDKFVKSIESAGRGSWSSLNKTGGPIYGTGTSNDASHISTMYSGIYNMARAYSTNGTEQYHNPSLLKDIIYALDWGYENAFGENVKISQPGNWWNWKIGAPQHLINTLIMMEPALEKDQILKYLIPIDYMSPQPSMTGANNTDITIIVMGAALLEEDAERLIKARDQLNTVYAYVNKGDGFYTDGSFIQHDKIPYVGSYGAVLIGGLADITSMLNGTKFVITDPTSNNVAKWIEDSYIPLMYKGGVMSMVNGRAISRAGGEHSLGLSIMRGILKMTQVVKPSKAKELEAYVKYTVLEDTTVDYYSSATLDEYKILKKIMDDESIQPSPDYVNTFVFGKMDRVVHHKGDFAFGLSMSSSRIYNYESINNENLRGWYTGDGMLYLYNDDLSQYDSTYWSAVDAYKLPGVTADVQERPAVSITLGKETYLSSKDFVGGVCLDNKYATAAMWLESFHSEGGTPTSLETGNWNGGGEPKHDCTLEAQKSWFMFDDEVVALGAGIVSSDNVDVNTTVENRKLNRNEKMMNAPTGAVEYQVKGVTAAGNDGNVEANVIDNNLSTRWSLEGDKDCWLQLDLGEVKPVGYAAIAFYSGGARSTKFDLEVSEDGNKWTTVYSGQSSGKSDNLEAFDLKNSNARYVRYNGKGNSANLWNSVSEFKLYAPSETGEMLLDINQGILAGTEDVLVNGELMEKTPFEKEIPNVSWVNLETVGGYYFPNKGILNVKKTDTNPGFLEMWLPHGANPKNETYAYVVLPGKTPEQTAAYTENPDVEILVNNESVQAVREKTLNATGMVFWKAGSFGGITASEAMTLMTEEKDGVMTVVVSDPTQKLKAATVTISGKNLRLLENDRHIEAKTASGSTTLNINFEESGGGTYTARFQIG